MQSVLFIAIIKIKKNYVNSFEIVLDCFSGPVGLLQTRNKFVTGT